MSAPYRVPVSRSLYHAAMMHSGPATYCLECSRHIQYVVDPELLHHGDKTTDEDDARFALTVRGWAASADGVDDRNEAQRAVDNLRASVSPSGARAALAKIDAENRAMDGVEQHAFSKAAEPVLQRALDLVTERGGTHGDTWRLPMETTYVDHVLALEDGVMSHSQAWKRLLICAAFVDMKSARFQRGEWKPDDIEDGINYAASFRTWRSEYDGDTTDAILNHQAEHRTAG